MKDVVYIYKHFNNGEELRYSLRSLKNLPRGQVFVSGDKPSWLSDKAIHIPKPPRQLPKYKDAEQNVINALRDKRLSEQFYMFNDDFFVMQKTEIPDYHLGTINECINERMSRTGNSPYIQALIHTRNYLQKTYGIEEPLNYSAHVPMVMNRKYRLLVSEIVARNNSRTPYLSRCIYGNLFCNNPVKIDDVKVYDKETILSTNLLSSDDISFKQGRIGDIIRQRFNQPSVYETGVEAVNS